MFQLKSIATILLGAATLVVQAQVKAPVAKKTTTSSVNHH